MWIVPQNLNYSAYALDTVDSKEDLASLESILPSSLMWRSKPSPSRTWSQRWKRENWVRLLFGRTLKPYHWTLFEERLTLLLEASPVSPLAPQASAERTKTRGTFFPTLSELSTSSDQVKSGSRTSPELLPLSSQAMAGQTQRVHQFCSMSLESWSDWVTEQRQDCTARRKQAHLTGGSAGLYTGNWQTQEAKNQTGYHNQANGTKTLKLGSQVLQNWGTPRVSNNSGHPNKKAKVEDCRLEDQVAGYGLRDRGKSSTPGKNPELDKNWATPNTMDYMDLRTPEGVIKQATGARAGRTRPANLREQVDPATCAIYTALKNWPTARVSDAEGGRIETLETADGFKSLRKKSNQMFGAKLRDAMEMGLDKSLKLNPRWVEHLMGVPVGWAQLPWEWAIESNTRTDELRMLGNAVVPQQSATAWIGIQNKLKELQWQQ